MMLKNMSKYNHKDIISQVQRMLNFVTHSSSDVGGIWTNANKIVMQKFQEKNNLETHGEIDYKSYHLLFKEIYPTHKLWDEGDNVMMEYAVQGEIEEKHPKTSIVWHHTVSNSDPFAVYKYFMDKNFATAFILGGNGLMVQCFKDFEHFGFHLNMRQSDKTISQAHERKMAAQTVAVEICNWGSLDLKNGKFFNTYGNEVNVDVQDYGKRGFRGKQYYHKYTEAQLSELYRWTKSLLNRYNLKPTQKKADITWFDYNKNAVNFKEALFTHTNVRYDKSDLHPQPELLTVINELINP